MPARKSRLKLSRSDAVDWSEKVELLNRTLREKNGVVDVKFAFGSTRGQRSDDVYRAVAAALEAVIEGKSSIFSGLNDSYGLRGPRPK